MGVPELTYHNVPLPALGINLPAAFAPATQELYFPVATVCEALRLEVRQQRARVNRDYPEYTEKLRLQTDGGPQELLCIEWTALGLWLATIHHEKTADEARKRLRAFRVAVMTAASLILQGKAEAMALTKPARQREANSLMLEHDSRLAALERAVFVGEPAETETGRISRCPNCGVALGVGSIDLWVVPERD